MAGNARRSRRVLDPEPENCTLQDAVGRHERCPGDSCPFWADRGCALDGVRADIETNPELAGYLLDLRAKAAGVKGWDPFRMLPQPAALHGLSATEFIDGGAPRSLR
jgi:hypothetical protein